MTLTSLSFLVFVSAALFLYFIVPKRYQWIVLLTASYVFYAFSGIKLMIYLLLTTATTFYAGIFLGKTSSIKQKRRIMLLVILFNIGILFILKFYNFTAEFMTGLLADISNISIPKLNLLVPLGLSIYIFQSIGYVIDIYRGKYEPERNIARFALFVSFFPQIIQGPISRYDQLAPQLYAAHNFDFDRLKYGIQLIMWGYFKKVIIADRAAVLVNTVFDNYAGYQGSITALAVFFYCIQIYCDFSGGIDIIRGMAEIMGINMIQNFKRPYFASSLAEFWRRWHISLGAWMKDYLFLPLSFSKAFTRLGKLSRKVIKGKMGKILPASLATFIVFFTIGIWHGISWKYIAFGIWNGTIITFSLIMAPVYARTLELLHIKSESPWWRVFQILRTTVIIFIGRYFTRGASLMSALGMMKHTIFNFGTPALVIDTIWNLGLSRLDFLTVLAGSLLILIVGYFQERGVEIRKYLEKRSFLIQWLVVMLGLIALVFLAVYRDGYISSKFIYQQF